MSGDRAGVFVVGKTIFPSADAQCDACHRPLMNADRVYMLSHLATPWKSEDDEDNEWSGYSWHVGCDEGSLAADGYR